MQRRGRWDVNTLSLARLEQTRTGVGSPGAKMESVVGVRRQEPEDWSGEMARGECAREESRADQKGTGKGRRGGLKVATGFSGKNGCVREGEWHGWEYEWAHEVGEGREERLPKEDMCGKGVDQDGRGRGQ